MPVIVVPQKTYNALFNICDDIHTRICGVNNECGVSLNSWDCIEECCPIRTLFHYVNYPNGQTEEVKDASNT